MTQGVSPETRQKLKAFDAVVAHLYGVMKFSTYQVAAGLHCTQGRVARSLRRTGTRRRTYRQAEKLRKMAA